MDMKQEQVGLAALLGLLKSAVREILHRENPDEFLAWMESEAPERFPEVFSGVDDRVVKPLALELGRQIWDATPLPGNGFQPRPLPKPEGQDPVPAIPGLTPELMGVLIREIGQEDGGSPE